MTYERIPGVEIVGFGHKARHGKDFVARVIHNLHPSWTSIFGFADSLKSYCGIVHGMVEKDPPLLQRVAQKMRDTDPDIWIRDVYRQLLEKRPQVALITDLRHVNEAEWIKAMGGTTVRIRRYTDSGAPYVSTDRDPNHVSEVQLNDWPFDYTIENRGTIGRLEAAAHNLSWTLFGR